MNVVQLIADYFDSKEQEERDRTDMAAVHLVFSCLLLGYDEQEALKLAKTSSRVFLQIVRDASDTEKVEFSQKKYISKFMGFYYFVITECLMMQKEIKDLFKNSPEWKSKKDQI